MKSLFSAAAAFAVVVLSAGSASAGAWPKEPGETLLIATVEAAYADEAIGTNGDGLPHSNFSKRELRLFGEHGLSRDLTLLGELIASRQTSTVVSRETSSTDVREITTGALLRLWGAEDGRVLSGEARLIFITASQGDDPSDSQPGDVDVEMAAYGGNTFRLGTWQSFSEVRQAFLWRPSSRPDEVSIAFALGTRPADSWLLMLKSDSEFSITGGSTSRYIRNKLVAESVWRLGEATSLGLGGSYTFRGPGVAEETAGSLALWFHF